MPDAVFRVWSAFLIGFVVFKYGWNAKRFTDAPEQDVEAEVDSEQVAPQLMAREIIVDKEDISELRDSKENPDDEEELIKE